MVLRGIMEIPKFLDTINKRIELLDNVDCWTLVLMIIAVIGTTVGILTQHIGIFIVAYGLFLISLALYYKKHPFGALVGFLTIIFFLVIVLAYFVQKQFDILTAGITLILVIITGWYAKNVYTQIQIMNNEKLGKVIGEIFRSIFSPLVFKLIEIRDEFESYRFIGQVLDTHIASENEKRLILPHYLEGVVLVSSSQKNRMFRVSAKQLLDINDPFLPIRLRRLNQLNAEYNKHMDEMNTLLKKFDEDFLPYWSEFKSKCISLSMASQLPILNEENYFKIVLKYTFTKQDATAQNLERIYSSYISYVGFINSKRIELLSWIRNITLLHEDIENIDHKKDEISDCLDEMVQTINTLHRKWKMTYYLTEDELEN
jgi:hypothetical protein